MFDAWLDLMNGSGCVGCPSPGKSLCAACAATLPTRGSPVRPTPCPEGLAACFSAGDYDGLLRDMVLAHKEHGTYSLAAPLGRALAAAASCAMGGGTLTVLVPVPSRARVARERGHDPMLRITRVAARRLRALGHPVRVASLLEQRAVVQDQAGLTSVQRAANLSGTMGVRVPARACLARAGHPVSLLVCDDVLTTGATAREAQRALEDAGMRVRAVVTVAATRRRIDPGSE